MCATIQKGAALLAALLFLSATACGRSLGPVGQAAQQPHIFLITIDALRADHLGLYGYDRPTSPHLDAFAREAVAVRNHIAQAPYTKASIASLFTGLFPTAHKAFTTSRSFDETMTGRISGALPVTDVLDGQLDTLAERLASAGYQTSGLNTNPFLLSEFGFAQGFGHYEFLADDGNLGRAPHVIARALQVVDARDRSRPLFLWLHTMEPHSPYTPDARIRSMFPPRVPPLLAPAEAFPNGIVQDGSLDAHLYEALYDGNVREADEALGVFFSGLRTRGLWDTSVVVVTSDHGEEFFEHGGFEHNRTLYDEVLRVPLVVKAPGLAPGMRDAQTQSVDILPTLAASAGVTVKGLHGTDIWPVLHGTDTGEPYAVSERVGAQYAVRTRDWKLISTLTGAHQLYNLRRDPRELRNLAHTNVDRTVQLRDVLLKTVAGSAAMGQKLQGQFAPIRPRVLERLKALGYLR